ncbi:MAG: PASTA domain-containing protein, partial [Actinomycetota bacterium]
AGAEVDQGTTLSVVISRGPELVEVPNVLGLTLEAARNKLEGAGLKIKATEREFHETVPLGHVIDQNPKPGNLFEVGEGVELIVSRGPPLVQVPDVVGRAVGDAGDLLRAADLDVRVEFDFSGDVERDHVISQTPVAGEKVETGTLVTIVVSKGPREFPMPDVIGMTRDAAVVRLEEMGLDVRLVQLPGSSGNEVVGQEPDPGTTVEQGQQVTIYIGGQE